jgi:dipeptidyl-peptidase-4
MKAIKIALIALLFALPMLSEGQGSDLATRYDRAVSFMWENLYNKRIYNLWIDPNWYSDSTGFWYTTQSAAGKAYWQVTWDQLQKRPAFDHQRLAIELTRVTSDSLDANKLPVHAIDRVGADSLKVEVDGIYYQFSLEDYQIRALPKKEEEATSEMEARSPKVQWTAFTRDYNLFLRDSAGIERQLSHDGQKGYEYATWYGWADIMEGENNDRDNRFYADWSPDEQWVYAELLDFRTARKMYLLDWSADTLYRPRLLSYYRGSPGDTTMIYQEPTFFHVASGKKVTTGLPRPTHINSMGVHWTNNPNEVILMYQTRGYQDYSIYRMNLKNGEKELLYQETSKTNIDNFRYSLALDNDYIFFLSERTGWRQLYSLNLKTKEVKALTKGEYYVQNIERIDEENEVIYFRASGKEKGLNPYLYHLYRIGFDGKQLKSLTMDELHHQVSVSPNAKYVLDNMSTVAVPTTSVLRDTKTGKVLLELAKADVSAISEWSAPESFEAIAGDGETKIHGVLWKPTDFDPAKKYPLIDNSYTGPHTNMYPSNFPNAFGNQALAELGFIVMRVDGRGSAGRSKAFHDFSYKNLGGGLTDHTHAIRQLGERFSWIDTDRVGIFGHSAGGYDAAHAVLAFPETYHVAVASSADHDHRMEKAWWPEMYMGWPVDSAYHLQSNITMAENLKGKLLITHGGIDENVNPSATFKLAEALVQADKRFDMLIFPSQRHGYRGKVRYYFLKSRWNYFVEHLLGEEPIWDFDWN